jgi:hypothetical protein
MNKGKIHLRVIFVIWFSAICGFLSAQATVPQSKMEEIYEEIKTPYKYGLVVAPTTNNYKVDCPSVFRDSGFADDTAKINVQQLLKQLSPETEMKVI